MAIVWVESFDFYGTALANLMLRGYALGSSFTIATGANTRTGLGALQGSTGSGESLLGAVLNNTTNVIGMGVAFNATSLPGTAAWRENGIHFGTGASYYSVNVVPNSDLGISVYNGTTLVGQSVPNVYTLNSYSYIEVKATAGAGTGSVEVRVNGNIVVNVTGLTITGPFTRFGIGKAGTSGFTAAGMRFDDWVVWDNTGSINNDFLGDRRCVTQFVNADGSPSQWAASAGLPYQCIDETTPSDTDYIQANNVGDISEFGKEPIGVQTNDIAAVAVIARALKTDAGTSDFRLGVNASGTVANSAPFSPNTTVAYYTSVFNRNPNGDIPWTKSAFDAATLRVTRES